MICIQKIYGFHGLNHQIIKNVRYHACDGQKVENRQCSGRPETAKPKPNNLVQHFNRYVIPPLLPVETAAEIVTIVKEARKAKEVEAARRTGETAEERRHQEREGCERQNR